MSKWNKQGKEMILFSDGIRGTGDKRAGEKSSIIIENNNDSFYFKNFEGRGESYTRSEEAEIIIHENQKRIFYGTTKELKEILKNK